MLLNEIINEVGMTKRAVKYYEEKGLLSVDKDNNGYRNYTAQDVETLKKISVYRKLGISIKDIQSLYQLYYTPNDYCQQQRRPWACLLYTSRCV